MNDILPLAAIVLGSAFIASLLTLVRDVQGSRIAERVAEIGTRAAAARPRRLRRAPSIRADRRETSSIIRSLCRLIGYDPALREQYKLPPLLVIGVSLAAAFAGRKVAGTYVGDTGGLISGVVDGALVARMIFGGQRARYRNLMLRQLPDVISGITRASQAGIPIGEGLRGVAREAMPPTREELSRVLRETALGDGLDAAISRLHHRTGVTEYAFLAVALGMQAQSGGSLAETLENLADTVRKRIAIASRARALAGEARTSAFILGGLPPLTSVALFFLRPGYMDMFFTTRVGNNMLTLAGGLMITGVLVIRWIIRKSTAA